MVPRRDGQTGGQVRLSLVLARVLSRTQKHIHIHLGLDIYNEISNVRVFSLHIYVG